MGISEKRFAEFVYTIDKVLIDEFSWRDPDFEKFWEAVMKRLGIPEDEIERVFIEVFGLERQIALAIYDHLSESY